MNRNDIEQAALNAKLYFEDLAERGFHHAGPIGGPGGEAEKPVSIWEAPRPTHVMVDHQSFRSILANRQVYLEYVECLADGSYTLRGSIVVFVYGRDVFKFFYMEA